MTAMSHRLPNGQELLFDFNALCEAEEILGPLKLLEKDMDKMSSVRTVRVFIWAGMLDSNPRAELSDAGKLVNDIGLEEAEKAIEAAFKAAWPEKFEKKKAPGNRKAKRKAASKKKKS